MNGPYTAVEGARANNNLFASMAAGEGAFAAGPTGVIIGRFGWAEPATGKVASSRTTPTQRLGFVLPIWGTWERLYCSENGVWILRSGQRCVLASKGDFWCRFAGGAMPGQSVWTSTVDGSAAALSLDQWTADSTLVDADSTIFSSDGGFEPGSVSPGAVIGSQWSADSTIITADSLAFTADGSVVGYELTQYRVMTPAPPCGLAVISPWSTFSPMH